MTGTLKVQHRKRQRGPVQLNQEPRIERRPEYKNQIWSCDFLTAYMSDDEPFEIVTVLDGYTRECLAVVVERRVSLEDIIDRLFDQFVLREVPEYILLGSGSESVAKAVGNWLSQLPVETIVVEPGGLWDDGCAESFKDSLLDEIVSRETFMTLAEARTWIGNWRRQYNQTRPQYSPLEDEPQVPQTTNLASFLEGELSTPQTTQPPGSTEHATQSLETSHNGQGGRRQMAKWLVTTAKVAEYVLIVLVILLMTAVVVALMAPRFGWRADTVLSGSMEPALPIGSVEVTRPVRPDAIKPGDIITFRSPLNGKLTSHRVIAVEEQGGSYQFRTKGDANEDSDSFAVPAQNVVGRVCLHISHIGYAVEYLKTPIGFILLGLCGVALILAEMSTMLEVHWKESAQANSDSR